MANAVDFIGLTKRRAQDLAEQRNLIFRLITVNGEAFMSWPEDKRDDRICVEINNGAVTNASIQ